MQAKNPKIHVERSFYRSLLALTLPVALQNVISYSVNLMDTLMLGGLGEVALSATSLANQVFFIYTVAIFGVAGGAIVLSALHRAGIDITTHIAECAGIADTRFAQDDAAQLSAQVEALASKPEGFAVLDETVEEPMKAAIRAAGAEGDSVGGMLETAILGLPAGIGEPYFDSVESEIAHLVFSVPAVKGIEFGTGFGFAGMRGSEANDAFRMTPEGAVVTATNHNAGINGGIANGMPVVFRTVVKPTPSIYKQQDTVDYLAKKDAQLSIQGRHDPCIVPRAAIVQTCAAALAVGDLLTARYGEAWMTHPTSFRKEDE